MRRNHQSKRKRTQQGSQNDWNAQEAYDTERQERQRFLATLHIQAHEADVVHGTSAKLRAQSLEVDASGKPSVRTALIKLSVGPVNSGWGGDDDAVFTLGSSRGPTSGASSTIASTAKGDVWVDRYDARLLLESFSDISIANNPIPDDEDELACSSWADFPEDSRETFFLSPEQAEDYHRIKRRRMIDEAHERRLREREEEDRNAAEAEAAAFDPGEPTTEALLLMERTAKHLLSATNPAQLEMRILANHGADERFSFLRQGGKWNTVWLEVKAKAAAQKEEDAAKEAETKGLGGLTGYGSDSDSDEADQHVPTDMDADASHSSVPRPPVLLPPPPPPPPPPELEPPPPPPPSEEDRAKEERRARARQWMLSRRGGSEDT